MMKRIRIGLIALATPFVLYAQSDTICFIQTVDRSTPGKECIEIKANDTIYVGEDDLLFGNEIAFCPSPVDLGQLAQIIYSAHGHRRPAFEQA